MTQLYICFRDHPLFRFRNKDMRSFFSIILSTKINNPSYFSVCLTFFLFGRILQPETNVDACVLTEFKKKNEVNLLRRDFELITIYIDSCSHVV